MTISTYTEPQPVNSIVDDTPQLQEIEDDVEEGAFAKLLAGLLRKTEIDETNLDAADFAIGEEGIQLFSLKDTDSIAVFENAAEKPEIILNDLEKAFAEDEFSKIEVSDEQASFLISAEHLLPLLSDWKTGNEETGIFLQELPEIDMLDFDLAEQDADFSPFKLDASKLDAPKVDDEQSTPPVDSGIEFAAETVAAQENKKSLPVETNDKKERVPPKDVYIETRSESSRGEEAASLRKEPEKAGLNRLDEARSRRRDRVAIDIRDQRTEGSNVSNSAETRINVSLDNIQGRNVGGDAPVREMTLELRVPEGQNQQAQTTWEVRSGNALENMLARELHQNFNGDIVRHASMALRDGGEATIRLALKPDTLGNVKIQLELTENKITGRIVVESEEALNAFKKEVASLEQAFKDSGFTDADLNLSLAAEAGNAGRQEQETDSWMQRNVASRYDSSLDGADQETLPVYVFFGQRPGSINMLA